MSTTGEDFAFNSQYVEVGNLKDIIAKVESENEALQVQCKKLNDEMLVRTDILSGVEYRCEQLEKENYCKQKEIEKLNDDNHRLKDEIKTLEESKVKLENELGMHVVDKKSLQQEIWYLKANRRDLEQRHYELKDQISLVNLNVESLQEMVKELRDGTIELKELCKKHENERLVHLENLKFVEKVTEQNAFLENSLKTANDELEKLRHKIRTLEEECENLCGKISMHVSEKSVLVSHIEAIAKNIEKSLEKNNLLENSLSDAHFELEDLRGKLNLFEESCQLLHDQNSGLLDEKNTVVAQVQSINYSLKNMESRYAELEIKNLNLEKEKEHILHQVQELQNTLTFEKEEHNTITQSSKNQLAALENQIEVVFQNSINAEIENFILQRSLHDMKEDNILLSNKCRTYLEKIRFQEELISEFKHEIYVQKKMLSWVSKYNEKLVENTHQVMRALNINKDSKSMDDIEFKLILLEIEKLKNSNLEAQDEKQLLILENQVILTIFEQESKSRLEELFVLQSEKNLVIEVNKQREKVLKIQMDVMRKKLSELYEAHSTLQSDTANLVEENQSFSRIINELNMKNDMLEENNVALEAELVYFEHMYLLFRSYNNEAKAARDELEKNNLKLLECNSHSDNEIAYLRKANYKLVGEVEELKIREKQSGYELANATQEIEKLLRENHVTTINAAIFEEKIFDLLIMCEQLKISAIVEKEMLLGDLSRKNFNEDKLKCKLDALDGENKKLMEELSAYLFLVFSLSNFITSLEGRILSLAAHCSMSDQEMTQSKFFEDRNEDCHITSKSGTFELHKLQAKINSLEEVVINIENHLKPDECVSGTNLHDVSSENEGSICKDIVLHLKNEENDHDNIVDTDTEKSEPTMKDIQLDHILISSKYEHGSSSQSSSAIGSDEIKDLQFDLWGTKVSEYDQELSGNVREKLSSDAQSISNLQMNAKELKESIETYETSNKPMDFEFEKVKAQLKEVENAILHISNFNSKLRKKVEQNAEMGKINDKKVMLRAQKGSEKIGKLELDLQKVEYVWLKFKEENDYRKAREAEKRTKVLLRDYFYGTKDSIRRKKAHCCACIKPRTKDD